MSVDLNQGLSSQFFYPSCSQPDSHITEMPVDPKVSAKISNPCISPNELYSQVQRQRTHSPREEMDTCR